MRAPRHLSAEERALWESVARQAKPLRKRPRLLKPVNATGAKPEAKSPVSASPNAPLPPKPTPKKSSSPPLAPIERRERSRLARGQREIDARLDLHGMTQARAHRALLSFLQRAQSEGCRYVLVITGKGKVTSPDAPRGVLRRLAPEWLSLPEFRAFVVSFEEAGALHGGAGALYVRIRRS